MAGTRGRTREQLRKSIGRNLIGHRLVDSAASSNDSAAGLIDDTLLGGDDNYNGWWIVVNSPEANRGSIRRISDYDSDANRLVWLRPLAEATAAGNRYELWPPEYPPPIISTTSTNRSGKPAGVSMRRSRTIPCTQTARALVSPCRHV